MMRMSFSLRWGSMLLVAGLCVGPGCSRFPKGPDRPPLTPQQSGEEAMKAYDANSDGFIDEQEVENSPGLKVAFERVDKDADGKLSAKEIVERIEYYKTAKTTILSGSTLVTMNGRPLPGAEVVFEPESFLGPSFVECRGVTDEHGVASISGHDSQFPGIYLGFYRVRISRQANGKEAVPKKYNEDTELGYEGADDIPMVNNVIQFKLKR